MAKNLIKTIQNIIFQQALFKRGAKIVLGVSGGADSVCMLDVLAKIAPKADLELLIVHVNYGLRGKDSDKDEDFVRELAGKYGMKYESLIRPSGTFSRGEKGFLSENVLRETRYAFFEKVRQENKFDFVAVAHNADDQVETYLMRIIRGAGLHGLSAMKYKIYPVKLRQGRTLLKRGFNRGAIIRPLLGITRQEILNHLKRNKLSFRTDKTNAQNLFFRNKVRNKLIPYLEKNFNPNIKQTILDSVGSVAEDMEFIEEIVGKTYRTNQRNKTGKTDFLSVEKILKLHPALRGRILLKFIEENRKGLKDIGSAHVAEVLKIVKSTKSKNQVVLCKGLKITRKGDKLIIEVLKR